jgi:catechol 2,3-dioxygenase-like lactoylglutathione lyase family enzyme
VAHGEGKLERVHHVGIPVRSIERSLKWYAEVFDVEPDFVQTSEGPETSRTVQLDDVRLRFAFLPIGDTLIELLEYERPVGADYAVRNCDVGASHVCLEVDDIHAAYDRMRKLGVEFSIEPLRLTGVVEGHWCCYFRDPDGIPFELWQRPR